MSGDDELRRHAERTAEVAVAVGLDHPVVARLVDAARELTDSIGFDDHGRIVGTHMQGGNGGLMSMRTIQTADELRRAIDALERLRHGPKEEDEL